MGISSFINSALRAALALSLVTVIACYSPQAISAEGMPEISLESAVLFALHNNPDVLIVGEQEKQVGFAIKEARSALYPQVTFDAKAGREFNDPTSTSGSDGGESTNSWQLRLLASQLLYDGKATIEEVARRKSLRKSARHQKSLTIEEVLGDTIRAYTSVWRYQRSIAEGRNFVSTIQSIRDKTVLMTIQGAESKAKSEYAESRLAGAQTELNNSAAGLASALGDLEVLTGRLPPFSAARPEQFDPTLRDIESYYKLTTVNTRSKLNMADSEALDHQKKSQEGSFLPNISIQAEARRNYDVGGQVGDTNFGSAMLVMNYKLFDGFARKSANERLQSQVKEYKYRQDRLNRDIRRSMQLAYNQLLSAKDNYASAQDEIISSETLQELYQKQFEQGEGDIINLIEGQERLHSARLRAYRLESDMIVAGYELLRQAGALRKEDFCESC